MPHIPYRTPPSTMAPLAGRPTPPDAGRRRPTPPDAATSKPPAKPVKRTPSLDTISMRDYEPDPEQVQKFTGGGGP